MRLRCPKFERTLRVISVIDRDRFGACRAKVEFMITNGCCGDTYRIVGVDNKGALGQIGFERALPHVACVNIEHRTAVVRSSKAQSVYIGRYRDEPAFLARRQQFAMNVIRADDGECNDVRRWRWCGTGGNAEGGEDREEKVNTRHIYFLDFVVAPILTRPNYGAKSKSMDATVTYHDLMQTDHDSVEYSVGEEIIHALTHGVGVLLSIAGLSWMLYLSVLADDPWRIVASVIYGSTLILLFLASTVYHSLYASRHRDIFKLLDHCAIYLLIAGTYTPFLLVAMRTNTGWWLFGTIWALATAGIVKKLWFRNRFPKVALASYLAMGWLVVVAAPQMAESIGPNGMAWLVAGGLSYSVGAIFYAVKRIPFNHAVWHVFVLGGGICHFFGVVLHVLPS